MKYGLISRSNLIHRNLKIISTEMSVIIATCCRLRCFYLVIAHLLSQSESTCHCLCTSGNVVINGEAKSKLFRQ